MKKILFVDHSSAIGGAEKIMLNICSYINRSKWDIALACSVGVLADKARAIGIEVHEVELKPLRNSPVFVLRGLRGAKQLVALAKNTGSHIFYSNTVRATFYASIAARYAQIPLIWHMHDIWLSEGTPKYYWMDTLWKLFLCRSASQIITVSQIVKNHLVCSRKTNVIYNGINLDRFDPLVDDASFRRENGIPLDTHVVGMVGRLRPWKGQKRFLKIAAHIHEQIPETKFILVGGDVFGVEDQYPQELHSMVDQLELKNCVVFTGQLDNIVPALAAMDVFVHPGDPEPFGLVNIEAMAMAKPIVAFAHGALPDIVVDNHTGILVEPLDETAMARAIIRLLNDPGERANMGRFGRERVLNEFNAKRMVAEVEDVVESVSKPD